MSAAAAHSPHSTAPDRLPEPEVTESDFGAFFDQAEAFCDAEEAAAAAAATAVNPSTAAFFGRLADEVIAGLRAAHTPVGAGNTPDWQAYAMALERMLRIRLSA